ncbi:MAG: adenine nucleotide alpha hydrolase [Acidobacteriota bacterium]|nr:adenine nucleotide alpha hydrolase [Acidobacteriota bacterium]
MKDVLLSWSSGKDSAWALHLLSQRSDLRVAALFTTFNQAADRVAMHGVARSLVQKQAQRARLPLWEVELPWPCSNADYEEITGAVIKRAVDAGISCVAFGDLFLQDIRDYRERQLAGSGLEILFPVWGIPTEQLARDIIAGGVKAKLTCVDPARLDMTFAGRDFDLPLLESLPAGTDPCGENGEFHTFVYDAPVFSSAIDIAPGIVVERDGFVFADFSETQVPQVA